MANSFFVLVQCTRCKKTVRTIMTPSMTEKAIKMLNAAMKKHKCMGEFKNLIGLDTDKLQGPEEKLSQAKTLLPGERDKDGFFVPF